MYVKKIISILLICIMINGASIVTANSDNENNDKNILNSIGRNILPILPKDLDLFNLPDENQEGKNVEDISILGCLKNLDLFNKDSEKSSYLDQLEVVLQELNKENPIFGNLESLFTAENNLLKESVPNEFIIKTNGENPISLIVDKIRIQLDNKVSNLIVSLISDDEISERLQVEPLFDSNSDSSVSNIYRVVLPSFVNIFNLMSQCEKVDEVVYVEPNYLYSFSLDVNDPLFDQQWALLNTGVNDISATGFFAPVPPETGLLDADIDAPEAWDIETGDPNIIVAVVDSGVDYDHSDLSANIWTNSGETPGNGVDDDGNGYIDDTRGWDFASDDNDPMDELGHGTHCSGTISAVTDNSLGVAGVCWNVKIMPVRIGGSSITISDAASGIIYAAENGADVISMSWGGYGESNIIKDALDYAESEGVVLVAAAGNGDTMMKSYPAAYDNVIAVAATDSYDERASFSSYGSWVAVSAPGVDILSLRANGTDMYGDGSHIVSDDYYIASGTSMACPHVSGLAALLLSKNDLVDATTIENCIKSGTDQISTSGNPLLPEYTGAGRINAYSSVKRLSNIQVDIDNVFEFTTLSGLSDITGSAAGSDFASYSLMYGEGFVPTSWSVITTSTSPVSDAVLGSWDTTSLSDKIYSLKLAVLNTDGQYINDTVFVTLNNEANILHVGGSGPNNFSSITEAMYYAGDGDTILIHTGVYEETVYVDRAVSIIGEGTELVEIEGKSFGDAVFFVTVDNVNINNLTFSDSTLGINAVSVSDLVVSDVRFKTGDGINLINSTDVIIKNNVFKRQFNDSVYTGVISLPYDVSQIIEDIGEIDHQYGGIVVKDNYIKSRGYGVFLVGVDNNIIHNNQLNTSISGSIVLIGSIDNTVTDNEITNAGGLFVYDTNGNTVTNNNINGKEIVYLEGEFSQTITDAGQVIIIDSSHITVETLSLSELCVGIEIINSNNCNIRYNDINTSYFGILLIESNDNDITGNSINTSIYAIDSINGGNTYEENEITNSMQGISVYSYDSYSITQPDENSLEFIITGGLQENNIKNNIIKDTALGIFILSNGDNNIESNEINSISRGSIIGVIIIGIEELRLYGSLNGMLQASCTGGDSSNIISDNKITGGLAGVFVLSNSFNTISQNEIRINDGIGIVSLSVNSVTFDVETQLPSGSLSGEIHFDITGGTRPQHVKSNDIFNTSAGILVISNGVNNIENNNLINSDLKNSSIFGIIDISVKSLDVDVLVDDENEILTFEMILEGGTEDCTIKNNNIKFSYYGIYLISNAGENKILDNDLSNVSWCINCVQAKKLTEVVTLENNWENQSINVELGGNTNIISENNLIDLYSGINVISSGNIHVTDNALENTTSSAIVAVSISNINLYVNSNGSKYFSGVTANFNGEKSEISDNKIDTSETGITLVTNAEDKIVNNQLSNIKMVGISLASIDEIEVSQEREQPLYLDISSGDKQSIIKGNTVSKLGFGLGNLSAGIMVASDQNIIVEENHIDNLTYNNEFDMDCESSGILLLPSDIEIIVENSVILDFIGDKSQNGNIIRNNVIDGNSNGHGISLWYSSDNTIYGNTIKNNAVGVHIPNHPLITEFFNDETWLQFNEFVNSYGNLIYRNNFLNNDNSAYDDCINNWDNGEMGNYWDDYTGVDADHDGIGDTPYSIPPEDNEDEKPLMDMFIDNTDPVLILSRPKTGIYLFQGELPIRLMRRAIIIGSINISCNATDDNEVERIELYIDNVLIQTNSGESLSYLWDDIYFIRACTIKTIAYDIAGNTDEKTIDVLKIL